MSFSHYDVNNSNQMPLGVDVCYKKESITRCIISVSSMMKSLSKSSFHASLVCIVCVRQLYSLGGFHTGGFSSLHHAILSGSSPLLEYFLLNTEVDRKHFIYESQLDTTQYRQIVLFPSGSIDDIVN